MATTSTGTVYTRHDFTPAGGDLSRYAVADAVAGKADIPTVLYCHGNGGGYNQFSASQWTQLRDTLFDTGWAYIEGTGGGLSSWGNDAARTSYEKAFQHVDGILDIGPVVILARSMGGIIGSWLGTQSPVIAPRCAGMIFNSATQDFGYRWSTYQDPDVMTAYGMTNPAQFATATAGRDPMLFPLSVWEGRSALWIVGSADATVPAERHGIAMHDRAGSVMTRADLHVVLGAGHESGVGGTYDEVPAMMAFLNHVAALTTPPVTGRRQVLLDQLRVGGQPVSAMYVNVGGVRRPVVAAYYEG
jgi:pimeloyl-ACP methyl ester carboxylesterase